VYLFCCSECFVSQSTLYNRINKHTSECIWQQQHKFCFFLTGSNKKNSSAIYIIKSKIFRHFHVINTTPGHSIILAIDFITSFHSYGEIIGFQTIGDANQKIGFRLRMFFHLLASPGVNVLMLIFVVALSFLCRLVKEFPCTEICIFLAEKEALEC
jgi:hypothetical protein